MSKLFAVIISLSFLIFAVSCKSQKENAQAAIDELIKTNASFFQKEDVDGYIATLDPESPEIADTKVMMAELFKNYDLKLDIESVKILKIAEENADVEVVQVTKKLAGGDFRDNRVKIMHHIKKVNGAWKISASTTIRIEYFDQPTE